MLLKGVIKEFSGWISDFRVCNQNLFFFETNRIWCFKDHNQCILYCECECDHISYMQFIENHIWTAECADIECKHKKYVCRDIQHPEKIIKNDKFPYPKAEKVEDYYVAVSKEKEYFYFFVKKEGMKKSNKLKTKCYDTAYDKTGIYAKSIFGKIMHLDFALNVVWQKDLEKKNDSRTISCPQLYGDNIIVNNGADPSTKQNGEIVAYRKADGREVWNRKFEEEPANCQLFGDRLYMAHKGRMVVIEACSGKTILDEPSGFESGTVDEILIPHRDHLVMVSKGSCAIRLFSGDGKNMIQHLDIPGGYETHDGGPIIVHNNKIYLRTYPSDMCLKGVKEGLLILELSRELEKGAIEIEDWPVTTVVSKKKDAEGHQVYYIDMHGSSLQDLLIYGEIALEEVPSIYGSQIWSDERRDREFGGKIVFCPSGIRWENEAQEKMEAKARFVENWCKEYDIFSGDGKHPIKIEVNNQESTLL